MQINRSINTFSGKSYDNDIVRMFDNYYNEAYYSWDEFLPLAQTDLQFYLGDQWDNQERDALKAQGRNTFVFNRIRRGIEMISGYQRKNRLSSVVVPLESSDQKTADQLSKLLLYAMNYCNGYHIISDCFAGALKTGWNLCSVWMDYREDPINGDIMLRREPFNAFITDPYFSNIDLNDCKYILRRKYLTLEETKSLLPGRDKELDDLYHVGWSRDEKFTWLPYQRKANPQVMMAYNEMLIQKWKQVPVLVDEETGEYMEWDGSSDGMKMFMEMYPQIKKVIKPKKYIEQHIIVNDVHMDTVINPYGLSEYNVTPFVATFEPESDQWSLKVQSLTRSIVDSQKESNRRRSQMIDMLDSQINSGWIAEEDSVVNPRSLFQTSQGKVIWKKRGSTPGNIEKIAPAQIPPSMFQLQELFDRDIVELLGINDAAFGIAENANDSGVMMQLRQGAAITNLQTIFDRLRLSQKMVSQKMLKLIQTWTPDKVKRILNEEPTEEFYNRDFTKYDIAIQEGMLTDNQKQMYFRQLVDLQQLGVPVTPEMLVEAAPIQGKSDYLEQIQQMQEQQEQQAQEQAQLQNEIMDSQRQSQQAKAISDIALSKERFTRAVANMGLSDERASEAVENRANAALERAKAMKELSEMDDNRLLKYLEIVRMMEETNKAEETEEKADDVMISQQGPQMPSDTSQQDILLQATQQSVNPQELGGSYEGI